MLCSNPLDYITEMQPLLAILGITDFAGIALIVFVFGTATSAGIRRRLTFRRIERKLDALMQHHGITLPCKLTPEVQRLASDPKQRIAAIKLHREQTGLGLAEAKAEVDDFTG